MTSRTKVGIVFDDGFENSSIATARLFEQLGLRAVFAVLAHPEGFIKTGRCGDWSLWNDLVARGHIVQPHGYTHLKLSDVPPPRAVGEVQRCLDAFAENLAGFRLDDAVYCCTYNTGTREVIDWLSPRVRAVRIGGNPFLSHEALQGKVWTSTAFGPADPSDDFQAHLDTATRDRPAALLYCLHGLDGDHWGAIATDHLRRALERILSDPVLEYWPLTRLDAPENP